MGSPLGPSGFNTSAPGALTGNNGSLPGMASNTQANVTAGLQSQVQVSPAWTGAAGAFFGSILNNFSNVQALVTAALDTFLADLCDSITGATGGFINLNSWAASLRADASNALSGITTIATGVTGNISGATSSSDPTQVGTAVGTLNTTVQTSATPPKITIVNTTQIYTQDAGAKSFTFDLFGGSGGAARGPSASGSGAPGGGGGIGGWQKGVTILASALPNQFKLVIGAPGTSGSADNTAGTAGGDTMVTSLDGSVVYLRAGGGGPGLPIPTTATLPTTAYNGAPGSGNQTWSLANVSGGAGGARGVGNGGGTAGSAGSAGAGGAGGANGANAGGDGTSNTSSTVPGLGGSGGGGGGGAATGNAGNGGNGGVPGGAPGGGGGFYAGGFNGNGGTAAPGQAWVQANF